ncbi:MAG: DUF47 family protein [Aigarchaeota archaeon]|nr:DUF47 family protein [Aigarchaeota archaeon]
MLRRIRDFFTPGEKKVFDVLARHLDLTEMAVDKLLSMFGEGLRDPAVAERYTTEIARLEREGDEIVRRLDEEISGGALTAPLTADFANLVDTVDSVLDGVHSISREVQRHCKYYFPGESEVELDIYKKVGKLVLLGREGVKKLRVLISTTTNLGEASLLARQIEDIEEQADDVKDNILDDVYRQARDLQHWTFHHLIEVTVEVDDMVDNCEDASDLVVAILTSLGI